MRYLIKRNECSWTLIQDEASSFFTTTCLSLREFPSILLRLPHESRTSISRHQKRCSRTLRHDILQTSTRCQFPSRSTSPRFLKVFFAILLNRYFSSLPLEAYTSSLCS